MSLRSINLIEPRILTKNIISRHLIFWGKGVILICLPLLMIYVAQCNWFLKQRKAFSSQTYIGEELTQKIKAISEIQGKILNLQDKNRSFLNLRINPFVYDVMAILSNCFNETSWIDNLSMQENPEPDNACAIILEGYSLSHKSLGDFLNRMANASRIKKIVLIDAKEIDKGTGALGTIQFKLSCIISKADKEKTGEEKT